MVTKNFKNLLAATLQSSDSSYGYLPVQNVSGRMYYLCSRYDRFPYSRTAAFAAAAATAGISVGRSSDAESDADYNLHDTITSGVNVAITNTIIGTDEPGDPYLRYHLTITNTTDSPITIGEVGYKQTVRASSGPGRTDYGDVTVLIDRTVLDVPITLAGRDAGVIVYKLKTNMVYPTKGGIEMVPFALGTDEQIAAMIDAAQLGTIDLQEDGGWNVSDIRKIHISAFTDPAGTSYPEQDIEIVISSFAEYNNCGNVLQFDFKDCLSVLKRMHPSNSTAGGYGALEMCTDTIPALVDAMPSWIKNRLKTFSVYAWDPSANELTEVEDCKLALRARVEMFGPGSLSSDAEGSIVDLYSKLGDFRRKYQGYSRANTTYAWTRTPYNASNMHCVYSSSGSSSWNNLTGAYGIAPFGCM